MNRSSIDHLARSLSAGLSRRDLARLCGLSILGQSVPVEAGQHKHTHHHKKKQKANFNGFGCVDVGNFCKNDDQCCSGICTGSKCQAHDVSTCVTGQAQEFCGGVDVVCVATDGTTGFCNSTTGRAGFCLTDGACFPCQKDADCVRFCGPNAACIVCPGADCTAFGTTTACVTSSGVCIFP